MNHREYPKFGVAPDRRIFPHVPLPENYKELVPRFYAQKRQEKVEALVDNIRKTKEDLEIRLRWHDTLGLTNISIGAHGGFDLDEGASSPAFEEHNLGGINSLIAAAIAQKYVFELLCSQE